MSKRDAIRRIRAIYRPLLRTANFIVEPFVISKADGWSGAYLVTIKRDGYHTMLMVTVRPR